MDLWGTFDIQTVGDQQYRSPHFNSGEIQKGWLSDLILDTTESASAFYQTFK
jgi:hypothetical protein